MFPFCAETSLKRCNHKKFLPDVGVQTWLVGTPLAHRHTWCTLVCLLSSSCTGSSLALRTTWRSRRRRFTSTAQNRSISSIQMSESSTCNRRLRLAYSNSSHFPCFLFSLKRSTFLQTTLHFPLLLLVVCTLLLQCLIPSRATLPPQQLLQHVSLCSRTLFLPAFPDSPLFLFPQFPHPGLSWPPVMQRSCSLLTNSNIAHTTFPICWLPLLSSVSYIMASLAGHKAIKIFGNLRRVYPVFPARSLDLTAFICFLFALAAGGTH